MKIVPLSKKYEKQSAELLLNYWKSRGMTYSKKYAMNYLSKGHWRIVVHCCRRLVQKK